MGALSNRLNYGLRRAPFWVIFPIKASMGLGSKNHEGGPSRHFVEGNVQKRDIGVFYKTLKDLK
jgi:hypothetical protein